MTSSLDKITWYGFAGVTVAFMLSPLVILILFCFSEGALLSFPITGLSFRWSVR
jgi:ABC-type spermidine/putrescine transport system permease subunit II